MVLCQRQVWQVAFRALGQKEDAYDAVQEVFIRVYRFLNSYDLSKSFPPWLYKITDRVCIDMRKRSRNRIDVVELQDEAVGINARQECDLLANEERRILAEGMERLPKRERQALTLRGIDGLSPREAAEILGTDPATVRQQAGNALLKLKDFTKKYAQPSSVKVKR